MPMAGTVPIHLTTRRLRLCMADLRGGRLFLGCGGLRGGFGWRAAFARAIVVLYVFNFAMLRIFPQVKINFQSLPSTLHFKKGQRVALLDVTTRKPSNLRAPKSSVVASRKSLYSKLQSKSRNLIWSDSPSSTELLPSADHEDNLLKPLASLLGSCGSST